MILIETNIKFSLSVIFWNSDKNWNRIQSIYSDGVCINIPIQSNLFVIVINYPMWIGGILALANGSKLRSSKLWTHILIILYILWYIP